MAKIKFYFKDSDSEICYTKDYFIEYMRENNLSKIDVLEALPETVGGGAFWCKRHKFMEDNTKSFCGKINCKDYAPRNKISGVCVHHTHWTYVKGKQITLKIKGNKSVNEIIGHKFDKMKFICHDCGKEVEEWDNGICEECTLKGFN